MSKPCFAPGWYANMRGAAHYLIPTGLENRAHPACGQRLGKGWYAFPKEVADEMLVVDEGKKPSRFCKRCLADIR